MNQPRTDDLPYALTRRGDDEAELWIYDQIGADMWTEGVTAKRFAEDLAAVGDVSRIRVRINSPGGSVFDGLAIYNALRGHDADVEVHIDGLAASIASVIAMAGTTISIADNALMMIHDPWSIVMGNAEEMRRQATVLDKIRLQMIRAYTQQTGLDETRLEQLLAAETWLTAQEAAELGFVDEIESAEIEVAAMARHVPAIKALGLKAAAVLETAPAAGNPSNTRGTNMELTNKPGADQVDPKEIAAKALADEKARRASVREVFSHFPQFADTLEACLDDPAVTVDKARERLLAKMGEGVEPIAAGHVPRIEVGRDAGEARIEGMAQALASRIGAEKRDPSNEYNGGTLSDFAREILAASGVSVKGLSRDGIARKVLAAHTSSDFPLLLSNTAGKVLRTAYENYPNTFIQWCDIGSVSDFKAHPRIQLGSFNSLETIPEGAEYKYGTIGEESETMTAATKGKALKLTRQMVVNDDLGVFARQAQMLGRAAARTVNADAYGVLTSNPTMSDGTVLFHSDHNNVSASGAAPSVATIAAGRAAMRKQKDVNDRDFLNIMPRFLLAPVAIEDTVWAVLNSTADPASTNSRKRNYVADVANLVLVTDPVLDENDAAQWYMIADPMDAPAVEVAFLDGNRTPFIDDDVEFSSDSLLFKVRLDYGVAAIDWRAAYRNAGN